MKMSTSQEWEKKTIKIILKAVLQPPEMDKMVLRFIRLL